jgi:DNA-binding transcriptional LysR family regulator
VALISAHTVAAEVADGRIVVLDVERLPVVRRWYVVRRADHRLLPPAGTLWNFLVHEGASHLPVVAVAPSLRHGRSSSRASKP